MKSKAVLTLSFVAFLICLSKIHAHEKPQLKASRSDSIPRVEFQQQGFNIRAWLANNGTISCSPNLDSSCIAVEYPVGSNIEHMSTAGLWIGAITDTSTGGPPALTKLVSRASNDMFGVDTFFRPDSGDFVSDNDLFVEYADTFKPLFPEFHTPLGIKILQKSYAWKNAITIPMLAFEYNIINIGQKTLDSVYVGIFADADVGPKITGAFYQNNYSDYLPDVRTAYIQNPVNRPSTPIGVTFLGASRIMDSLKLTFRWFPGPQTPATNQLRYDFMSSGHIDGSEYPFLSDTRFVYAFGPFSTLYPNDTIRLSLALVSGDGLIEGENTLRDNAAETFAFYKRGYKPQLLAPSPSVRIAHGRDSVLLDWSWKPGDPGINPLETWDDSARFLEALPDTHWRRRDPPPGHSLGGRTFEGFRIYRSDFPPYGVQSFGLLKQYDVNDGLGIDNGLQFSYTDSNLFRGRTYSYAVTSLTMPEMFIVKIPDSTGYVDDTITTSRLLESDIASSAHRVEVYFGPSKKLGQVKVVPNPYRADNSYTDGNGPEGLQRSWTDNNRQIWFTNLPERAIIRIFTLAGEVIHTIDHDDAARQSGGLPLGQEEWRLFSEGGKQIASGLYVYTVESSLGTQTGKFVIIK